MSASPQPETPGAYSEWKGWAGGTSFAHLDAGEADYFARELRDIERATTVRDVLEVGYGNGEFLGYCRSRGWNTTGMEILPELIAAAQQSGFPAFHADELPGLPAQGYDLIAAFDVLEHIPPDQTEDFLRALAGKLRPGGRMLFRFPNADTWIGAPMQNGDPTHVNAIGVLKLGYYATTCELRVVSFRGAKRRGFRTSVIHGLHRATAGVIIGAASAVKKALYFPDVPVVLSTSNVVAVLTRDDADQSSKG